jgi:hypothetical protein
MSIATITATAKSKRAVWWLFRSFLMRESLLSLWLAQMRGLQTVTKKGRRFREKKVRG